MQFEFKNLGTIKEAQLEMGNLTVICGKNNTGKTYLTYGVWGILAGDIGNIKEDSKTEIVGNELDKLMDIEEVKKSISKDGFYKLTIPFEVLEKIKNAIMLLYEKNIKNVFASSEDLFSNVKINLEKKKNKPFKIVQNPNKRIKKILNEIDEHKKRDINIETYEGLKITIEYDNDLSFCIEAPNNYFEDEVILLDMSFRSLAIQTPIVITIFALLLDERVNKFRTFLLPAQRDSIELFYKEIDKNRSHLLEKLRATRDLSLLDKESSRFPQPIEKLIDFARDLTRQVIKTESFLAKEQPELLKEIENLLGVTYEVSGDEVLIKDQYSTQKVPVYMASTSVRSLMHLHFWLKHKAQKGDLLMIDEPELNLHPENQIKMARLFAKLVNAGIKVWITTHSDYIIKELNNCLMFSQDIENKNELLEELGYKENEILKRDDIRAYIARYDEKLEGCTVDKVEFDEYGMVMTTFDEQARNINRIAHRLADEIDEKQLKQTSLEND